MTDENAPTLPHGTQPTERQWQIAEALDDLVMAQGVVLDDDRLDWLVEWVAARAAAECQRRDADWQDAVDLANARRQAAVVPLSYAEGDILAKAVHSERGYYAVRDAVNDILQARADA